MYYVRKQEGLGLWYRDDNKQSLKSLIDKVVSEKNIDSNKIILVGYSMGGIGAMYIAHEMPEYFSKLVVLSGYNPGVNISDIKIPTIGYVEKNNSEENTAYMNDTFKNTFGKENLFELDCGHLDVPRYAFTQDSNDNDRSDLIEWMFDDYTIKSNSGGTTTGGGTMTGGTSTSGGTTNQYEDNNTGYVESPMTGLDAATGLMLEPTVEFFTVVIDSIMAVFTSVMTQSSFEPVMVDKDNLNQIPDLGDIGTTHVISDMNPYRSASGSLEKLQYPRFTYSPEEIFAGKIPLLNANFISESDTDEGWNKIRSVIASWYKVLRMVAIIGLLSMLIYTGIKIILTSNAKNKAKYKEMLINWFIAVALAFSLHYIMAFILMVIEEIQGLLNGITGVVSVNAGGTLFKTNLIGLARFKLQQQAFSAKVGYLVIYTALVVYTFKFTFLYLKRVLRMAFLTVISPIVALTYPLDKMEGKAKGFELWLKEFVFNALLQPVHYILYYILVSSSLSLAANNLVYGIAALMFISTAEKLLKRIFGFDKANGGTVGGIAGAYAAGAIASSVANFARDPLHPFGGGKNGKSGKLGQSSSNNLYDEDEMPSDFKNDFSFENFLPGTSSATGTILPQASGGQQSLALEEDGTLGRYRTELSQYSNEQLGGLRFNDGDSRSLQEMTQQLSQNGSADDLRQLLQYRLMSNESLFETRGIAGQYIDGDSRSNSALLNDVVRLNALAQDSSYSMEERQRFASEAQDTYKLLERRMIENQYIQKQQNSQPQEQQTEQENLWKKFKNAPVTKGVANVAKTIAKPVWDAEKDWKYNGKRIGKNILKGVAGASVGIAAATVQAGISITDGKYKPMEGVATATAGMAVGAKLVEGNGELRRTYQKGANEGDNNRLMKQYGEQWFNRDDTIQFYNREFPGKGKEMRKRAVENYVSRGITDMKEQKKAIKFAELLRNERGMDIEEADKVAVATLQYRQNLTADSNYKILFDEGKRKEYLDAKADAYVGSASKDRVKQVHEEFIQNVRDFDRANR